LRTCKNCKFSSFFCVCFLDATSHSTVLSTPTCTSSRLLHSFHYPLKRGVANATASILYTKENRRAPVFYLKYLHKTREEQALSLQDCTARHQEKRWQGKCVNATDSSLNLLTSALKNLARAMILAFARRHQEGRGRRKNERTSQRRRTGVRQRTCSFIEIT
jgi:hypothetical protein